MRITLLFIILFISNYSFSQFRSGFDSTEVKVLVAMCNSYTFEELYGADTLILPEGYQKIFTSKIIGMDNRFQVYKKGKVGVINFRGSTSKLSSWVENLYSAMIPAQGIIKVNGVKKRYAFAKNKEASIHSGYALAVVLMSPILIEQIKKLNKMGIYNIILTGHSQGGALANLSRAYLENAHKKEVAHKNEFKTYAFANPMCGNKLFSEEYKNRYCKNKMSFSIINSADIIPRLPMQYQSEGKLLTMDRLVNVLTGTEPLDLHKLGTDLLLRKISGGLKNYIGFSNRLIERLVSKSIASIEMPTYTRDINYFQTGIIKILPPFIYPDILVNSPESGVKVVERNGKYYKKEASFFQHRPYNYYVAVLKKYFPKDFKNLKKKYLSENL